jgi:signal transduction histidine kinase
MYNHKTAAVIFLIIITVFILAMITFIVFILFYVQKKQKAFNEKLMEAKEKHLKDLYGTKLEVQEKINEDLSMELHDNVGQYISLARLGLGTLDLDKKDESRNSLNEISQILEKSLADLRLVCRTMNSEVIKKGGLKKSIEMQVGYIQRLGKFNIDFQVNGEHVRLDEMKEMVLFRMVQEAFSNTIRHSAATDICISLCYSNSRLKLQIQDNGKGFNIDDQILESNHLNGLYNLKHRANLIGADFQIDSKIGSGTSITVNTPY